MKTHDFMNVNSFSNSKEIPIRLFGFEFGTSQEESDESKDSSNERNESFTSESNKDKRFKCHYCFRNFPTSQALGGHQNAHKRERQQTKRFNLHSKTATFFNRYQDHGSSASRFFEDRFSLEASQISDSRLGFWRRYYSSTRLSRDNLSYNRLPLFIDDHHTKPSSSYVGGGRNKHGLFCETKTNVPDHVSLDLRL